MKLRILFLLLFFCSCSSLRQEERRSWMEEGQDRGKIVCSIAMIGDIVSEIAAEHLDVYVLIDRQLDPHSYEPVKGDLELLARADCVFLNGLTLEHPSLLRACKSYTQALNILGPSIIALHEQPAILWQSTYDPHIWMDVSLWSIAIELIEKKLSQLYPQHAESFRKETKKLQKKFKDLDTQMMSILQRIPSQQRYLITSHDAFHYFARRYLAEENELLSGEWRERCRAPEGLAPDSQISAADIMHIMDYIKTHQLRVLFTESNISKNSLKKILHVAQMEGEELFLSKRSLYGDAMGSAGTSAGSYRGMMLHNAESIYEGIMQKDLRDLS